MSKADILKQIVAKKKERIILAKQQLSQEDLIAKLVGLPATRPFKEIISKPKQISLIAEIKQASPSKGIIRQNFNLEEIARFYQEAGVQAVSVLTESVCTVSVLRLNVRAALSSFFATRIGGLK